MCWPRFSAAEVLWSMRSRRYWAGYRPDSASSATSRAVQPPSSSFNQTPPDGRSPILFADPCR